MHGSGYKLTISNKLSLIAAALALITVALISVGLLVVVGLTLLLGLVLAAIGIGVAGSVFARFSRRGSSDLPFQASRGTSQKGRLDPAQEVFLPSLSRERETSE